MRTAAKIGLVVGVAVVGLALVFVTMRAGLWATNYETARARWAGPPSTFVKVDGVDLHVRDEGQGPVIVLLHGSIVNLHEWDPVAERLKSRYRVVRLDWPPYGVSGLDPSGVYTTKRAADLVAGLTDKLGLDRFVLVSTSNGANVALQYVADHPEHVSAMAFSILPLERPSQTRKVDWRLRWMAKFHAAYLPDYHPKYWFRLMLKDTTRPGFVPPEDLVDMIYDANNLPGAAQRQRAYIASNTRLFKTTDVGAIASKVHVPVLLQWCALDTVISQGPEATVRRFTNAPVEVITYKDLGHFPMWEDPDRFTADLERFARRFSAPARP